MRLASLKKPGTDGGAGRITSASICVYAFSFILLGFVGLLFSSSEAAAETRTLKMYYTHSKESATITFKKNGKYLKSGLRQANRFLRDWRRKEPTRMDPELLDLVWEVYQKSGSRSVIYVISGYRSPKTNNMLRRRGRKVARTSQHTRGKALDFFLKDVSVEKLRNLGLQAHRGGVGYYRGSFVHLDTGRVRHWPRMSKRQLARVFPRGKTIHVPSNGRPLRGYKTALLNLKKGLNADGSRRSTTVQKSLLARIFTRSGSNDDEGEDEGATVVALKSEVKKPRRKKAATVAAAQPKPKKATGPDPFSAENKAARDLAAKEKAAAAQKALDDAKKIEADKKLKEIEEAKAIEVAKAEEEAAKETEVAALAPERLAVPRSRPVPPAPVLALAPAAEPVTEQQLAPMRATELALAAPPAIQGILRPPAEVPGAAAARGGQQSTGDINRLKQRIETALARPRVRTAAETAAELQSNARLAKALKPVTIPRSPTQRPVQKPAAVQLALAKTDDAIPLPVNARDQVIRKPVTARADESLAITGKVSLPAWRSASVSNATAVPDSATTAKRNDYQVPVPSNKPERGGFESQVAAIQTVSREAEANYLELGNLDGSSVKKWAVSLSTRVGPVADLQAPIYRQGTTRAVPKSVYSIGFEFKSPPLRADRFSGKALTRVAFAHFGPKR